jgi:cytochrome P450 family 135
MDSSDLFSHIQAPQVPVPNQGFDEPVEAPVFSDQPRRETRADSRST